MTALAKDTWIIDLERVLDDYPHYLTWEEAEGKLIALGFDDDEIAEMLSDKTA